MVTAAITACVFEKLFLYCSHMAGTSRRAKCGWDRHDTNRARLPPCFRLHESLLIASRAAIHCARKATAITYVMRQRRPARTILMMAKPTRNPTATCQPCDNHRRVDLISGNSPATATPAEEPNHNIDPPRPTAYASTGQS